MLENQHEQLIALQGRLVVTVGDITQEAVDAIVNAASHFLVGTDGCSGAVLSAGGPSLFAECARLGGCEEGDAKLTGGYLLPARYVIHTVAPVWRFGHDGEQERLERCYRKCFELAEQQECRTVAFPSLGTGGHACPGEWSARIAVREIAIGLSRCPMIQQVKVVCYDRLIFDHYRKILKEAFGDGA